MAYILAWFAELEARSIGFVKGRPLALGDVYSPSLSVDKRVVGEFQKRVT